MKTTVTSYRDAFAWHFDPPSLDDFCAEHSHHRLPMVLRRWWCQFRHFWRFRELHTCFVGATVFLDGEPAVVVFHKSETQVSFMWATELP